MTRATLSAALAVLLLAGCGTKAQDRPGRFDPFTEVHDRTAQDARRASPRWEPVATFSGAGPADERFTVARGAIQWRARWSCESGRLRLSSGPTRLADGSCPRRGAGVDVRTGALELAVDASGPWRVVLEQQVDTPLHEPPLVAMRSPKARVIARGSFYPLERSGRGTASLYRLPGGRLALRLDGFATSANTDLFVWVSTAPRPRTTVEAARGNHVVVHALKSTLGEQNYVVPAGVLARDIRSVVIWCVPVRIAYTAASLR
jgi:hypothetical protein